MPALKVMMGVMDILADGGEAVGGEAGRIRQGRCFGAQLVSAGGSSGGE